MPPMSKELCTPGLLEENGSEQNQFSGCMFSAASWSVGASGGFPRRARRELVGRLPFRTHTAIAVSVESLSLDQVNLQW